MPTYIFTNAETGCTTPIEANSCEEATEKFLDASNIVTRTDWKVAHALDMAPILVRRAHNRALDAFWTAVAGAFPEIEFGDTEVPIVTEFESVALRAIEAWLHANL